MHTKSSTGSVPSPLTRRDFLRVGAGSTLVIVVGAALSGCGAGQGNATSHSNTDGTTGSTRAAGKVSLTIAWDRPTGVNSRYIPAYAQSLYFELYKQDTPEQRYKLTADRPATPPAIQTVTFAQLLPVGTYTLAAAARTGAGGSGATVASAVTTVTVTEDTTATADIALNSTIKALQVLGQPLSLLLGTTLPLHGEARDPDGKLVVVPTGALQWNILSGADIVSIAADGTLTAKAVGTAQIQLVEVGAGISSAPAAVTVTAERNPNLVWVFTNDGQLGYLDVLVGEYTRVGFVLDSNANTLALDDIAWSGGPSPKLYGITSRKLYTLDPASGSPTLVGDCGVRENLTGLAFRADGRLYASGAGKGLYELNLSTAAARLVGIMPAASAGDIDFDMNDQLYMASIPSGIWKISADDATGVPLTQGDTTEYFGIAFTGGALYGFSVGTSQGVHQIKRIDIVSGAVTTVRPQPNSLLSLTGASARVGGASHAPR